MPPLALGDGSTGKGVGQVIVRIEGQVVGVQEVVGRDGRVGYVVGLWQQGERGPDVARLWLGSDPGVTVGEWVALEAWVDGAANGLRSIRVVGRLAKGGGP